MYQNVLSISPGKIVDYWQYEGPAIRKRSVMPSLANLQNNNHNGVLSKNAKKRMLNAIDWLLAYAVEKLVYQKSTKKKFKFKVGFVTLTLSSKQNHSDTEIKKQLLNHFLVECRKRWEVIHYVWRAERQKNGNIHFHILTDKFIPYQELRNVWNRIQNKLGYVDTFTANTGKTDPNSTDVHSVVKIRNIRKYVSKYMSKQQEEEPIQGQIWGLSYSLSKSKPLQLPCYGIVEASWVKLREKFKEKVLLLDHCGMMLADIVELGKRHSSTILAKFMNYLADLRDFWQSDQLSIVTI